MYLLLAMLLIIPGMMNDDLDLGIEESKLINAYAPPLNKWGTSYEVYSVFGGSGCKISVAKNHTNGNIRMQVRYNTDTQSLDWHEYTPGTWIKAQVVYARVTSTSTGGSVILRIDY